MRRMRVFVAVAVAVAVAVPAAVVLTGLLPLGREDPARGTQVAADAASPGFDVWVLTDEDWRDLDDGLLCADPGGEGGCADLTSTTFPRPWLHFEAHPQPGQQVDLVYAKATNNGGLSSTERVVVAELPYELFEEAGAAGVSLWPNGPTSFRELTSRGTCPFPCGETEAHEILIWALNRWENLALQGEMQPPEDGHVRADVYFPTHPTFGGPEAGPVTGTLVERHGCLFSRSGPDIDLLLWPPGHRAVVVEGRTTVLDPVGEVAAVVGGPITLGGGMMWSQEEFFKSGLRHFEKLAGEPVPARCQADSGWWITELVQPGEAA